MINSISNQNNYWWLSQLNQTNQPGQSVNGNGNDQTGTTGVAGGGFINALATALSQIGINSTSSSSSNGDSSTSSSSQDPSQALASFLQDLMNALQSQHAGQLTNNMGTDGDNDNDGSSTLAIGGASGHHHHHHNRLEANLQSLILQLSSSNPISTGSSTDPNTNASTSTANNAVSGSAATSSALSTLQQSFQNLLTAFGDTSNSANLQNFIQTFANNLDGSNPVGKVIQTQA